MKEEMRKNLIQTFTELVSIDSTSLKEREMAQYLKRRFAEIGIELEEDEGGYACGSNTGNLYAYIPGELPGEPILLATHMDTVEPSCGKKAVLHEDGRITSDGTTVLGADDLTGVTAVLEAVRELKEKKIPHRSFEVLFTVAEELYCVGANHMDYTKIKSKRAYALDMNGRVGTAAYAAPSLISFCAEIQGKAAHAGFAPETGVHAIAVAAKAICQMKMGHLDRETTANVGTIEGGVGINVVPENCVLRGEVRSMKNQKALDVVKEYKEILEKCAEEAGAKVNWEQTVHFKAYETALDHPVVTEFKEVCEKLHIPVSMTTVFGGSDNNVFADYGIKGLVVANAMEKMHSCEEYTEVSEMERITEIVEGLLAMRF